MAVSYKCTGCGAIFSLSPQSPGFGQMRAPCPTCGQEAVYAPAAVAPRRAHSSVEADAMELEQALSAAGAEEEGPDFTVPLQTPDALLKLDAMETAPTVPVSGLSAEQLKALDEKMGVERTTPEAGPAPTVRMAGLAELGEERDARDSTVRQPGLSEEILHRATANLPLATTEDPKPDPENELAWMEPPSQEPSFDIDEDKIPTRSVEGLADRSVKFYAGDLYNQEARLTGVVAEPDPKEARKKAEERARAAVAEAQAKLRQTWEEEARNTPRPSAPPTDPQSALDTQEDEPANPTFAMGSPLQLSQDDAFSLNADQRRARRAPTAQAGGSGPRRMASEQTDVGRPQTRPSFEQGQIRRPPEATAPPRSGLRSTSARVVLVGVVFVVVFFTLLGGLYFAYHVAQQSDQPKEEPPPAQDTRALPRHQRLGLPALDKKAPFTVQKPEVKVSPDKKGTLKVSIQGAVINQGDNALDRGVLQGTVALWSQGKARRFPMTGAGLAPEVSRKQIWKPGAARSFSLEARGIPADASGDDLERVIWLSLEGGNGKVYRYQEAFEAVNF